jgi:hypothetical protein
MIGCVVNPVGLSGAAVFAAEGADIRGMNNVLRLNMICKAQLTPSPLFINYHNGCTDTANILDFFIMCQINQSINQCCSARLDKDMVGAVVPTRWILRLATCPQSRQIQSGPTLHPTPSNNPHILLLFEDFFFFSN